MINTGNHSTPLYMYIIFMYQYRYGTSRDPVRTCSTCTCVHSCTRNYIHVESTHIHTCTTGTWKSWGRESLCLLRYFSICPCFYIVAIAELLNVAHTLSICVPHVATTCMYVPVYKSGLFILPFFAMSEVLHLFCHSHKQNQTTIEFEFEHFLLLQ